MGPIQINNPTNYERANIYTFKFQLEDELPRAGYIQIFVPPSVTLSPSTTQSSGSCKDFTCTYANETMVMILMQ